MRVVSKSRSQTSVPPILEIVVPHLRQFTTVVRVPSSHVSQRAARRSPETSKYGHDCAQVPRGTNFLRSQTRLPSASTPKPVRQALAAAEVAIQRPRRSRHSARSVPPETP